MTADDFVDEAPNSWRDAFPWLGSHAMSDEVDATEWRDQSITDASWQRRQDIVAEVANLALTRLGHWPIGEVFPGMPPDVLLAKLDLSRRALNVLAREEKTLTQDLVDLLVDELLAFKNAGVGTVSGILRALADLSTSTPQATLAHEVSRPVTAPVTGGWVGSAISDMELLAEWRILTGQHDRGLLDELPLGAPADLVAARARMLSVTADDVAGSGMFDEVATHLEHAFGAMDERFRAILARRLFAWSPATLDELGKEFGVTRERVRQLEARAKATLDELVAPETPVGRVAEVVRAEIRGVRPLTELVELIPSLTRPVPSVGQPVWRVLDIIDPGYEIADNWCAEPSFAAATDETAVALDELADEHGVALVADLASAEEGGRGGLVWLRDWLVYLGYEMRGDHVLLRTKSLQDLAAAVLSIEAGPITIEDLHARIGRGSMGSLRNQISTDGRFHKVDMERWALASWGGEGYSNIRDEIGKLLEQGGGELALSEVVESLVSRFGVSPNSVTAYAGSAPYVTSKGVVRFTESTTVRGKNPAKVRRYYRRGDDWVLRVSVTHDHLRGSGWPASTAMARLVGLQPLEYVELPSRLGPQRFSWKGNQPAFGSIKRFLEDIDAAIGDDVLLVFGSGSTFDVESMPPTAGDPMAQALRLVGAPTDVVGQPALDALCTAVEGPIGLGLPAVIDLFAVRRDQDVVDQLEALAQESH